MCDCFHLVLPNWPGSPASVSGRQLRPDDPDAETEEDNSVNEVPIDEIIRPRPQGSSPVYEYSIDQEHFIKGDDTQTGRFSSGRRKSRWKRDSGESQSFSGRNQSEEPMEITLQTDVEAGASGYSVTGGGKEGIFVKQVLKDSSAAKLFSMREGDQLLSATIYFDNIKYEDALKILQYSEPYKVQFNLKRKLASKDDTEKVHRPATSDIRETDQQGEDLTDGTMETMEKMLEEEEDKEKLIVKSRTGRSQRPKKERLSWPKFQAKKTKKVVSHRRSHSTSDACEGRAPDLSPTSTDTELHFPKEETHLREKKGSERKRKFLNIGFRMHRKLEIDDKTSKSGITAAEARARTAKDGERISLDLQKPEMELGRLESQSATIIPEHLENEENRLKLQLQGDPGTKKQEQLTSEAKSMSGAVMGIPSSVSGTLSGSHVSVRGRRKKSDDVTDTVSGSKHGLQAGKETRERLDDTSFGVRGLEIGIAKLTLQESQEDLDKGYETPEIRVKIPTLQTPKFGFSKGKVSEAKLNVTEHEREQSLGKVTVNWGEMLMEHIPERNVSPPDVTGAVEKISVDTSSLDHTAPNISEKGAVISDWKAQTSSKKITQMPIADISSPKADIAISSADVSQPKVETQDPEIGKDGLKMEGEIKMGDKDIEGKDSKFKMPKFKMPSFGWSPSKEKKGSGEVPLPKEEVDISKDSLKRDDKGGDQSVSVISAEIPSRDMDLSMKSQKGEATVKDHKDKEEMRFKESKDLMENIQIPQTSKTDIEETKVDIIIPRVDVSLPKVKLNKENVGAEVERANVKGDVRLKEKEIDHKESKFRIPKFSMPGFSWGGGKEIGSSVDIETNIKEPKTIPSHSTDKEPGLASKDKKIPSFDVNVQIAAGQKVKTESKTGKIPSIKILKKADSEEKIQRDIGVKKQDIENIDRNLKGKIEGTAEIFQKEKTTIKGIEKEIQIPELEVEIEETKEKTEREAIKEHMTKYSIKTAKGNIKGPKVNIKMPDIDVTIPKAKDYDITTEVQVERVKVEDDNKVGDKEMDGKDSKFRMPKFKMPSFGGGKEGAASVDVSLPQAEVDVTFPSIQVGDLIVEGSSVDMEVKELDIETKLPEGEVQLGELKGKRGDISLKGHLPKVHMPTMKMPQLPKADSKGPKVDITMPSLDVSLTKGKGDIKSPEVEVEGDIKVGDKEVEAKDSKFKMPKFKMPSFGVSGSGKEASGDLSLPKAEMDVTLPSVQAGDLSVEMPSVDVDVKSLDIETDLPEAEVQLGDLKGKSDGTSLKGHLSKVHMPTMKMPQMPKADIKGPKVDVTMPSLDVSLTKGKGDIKSPEVEVEGDIKLGDKEVEAKDSKFKMPKFKMPSFGVSGSGKEGSGDLSLPKAEVDVTFPSVQAGDLSVELPSVDVDVKSRDIDTKLPEGEIQLGDLKSKSGGISFKGHLPKVHMPTMTMPQMPKADIKGPKVDITMPSLDVSLPKGKDDIKSPEVEIEGDIKVGDKEVEAKDSKFKMPKFKMPSFGVSAPGKEGAASVDVSLPSTEVDVALPSAEVDVKASDLSVDMPSVDVDVKGIDIDTKLPEAEVQLGDLKQKSGGITLKGHLPSIKMPQMPKADIKGPKVDVTMPSLDVSLTKGKGDIKSPEVEVEGDIKLRDKDVEAKDSKFKMPKFKMPSFGVSAPGKEGSGDLSLPKAEVDVTLPSVQAGDLSGELPSVDVDVKSRDIDTKLPEGEVQLGDLKSKSGGISFKGHLPKVHMPTMKMPQMPKADTKGPKVDITMPSVDVSLPKGKDDIKSPEVEIEGDIKVGDKEMDRKDSKFKMPKFKMPSFGMSAPGKEGAASMDMSLPSTEVDVALPSAEVDVKASDLSVDMPSVDVDVKSLDIDTKLPEAEVQLGDLKGKSDGISLKGHLPKVHMPTMKMPQTPKADIKGPKVDITMPSLDVSLTKGKGDIKSPEVEVEGDIKLGEKDVEAKDSKFKMPKFKMPSFGVSASGKEGSGDLSLPKADVDVTLPSVQAGDLSVEMPSVDVDVKGIEIDTKLPEGEVQLGDLKGKRDGMSLKGHLPKLHMPTMKMPQMPKADIKGPKVDITMPSVDVSLPKGKGDIKSPEVEVEGDIKLGDKEVEAKDSKFKMPKFKMPSFGVSGSGKEGSGDLSLPKAEVDVTLPSVQAGDLSVELPSVDVVVKSLHIDTDLPEAEVQLGDLKGKSDGTSLKGHLPKFHMPTMKMPQMPKADIKGPKVDVTMPSLDMSLTKGKGDIKSPEVEVEGDIKLGDKEVEAKDSKFKMPKFKMPYFGVSAPGKEGAASMDMSLPSTEVDVALPSAEVDVKASDLSVDVPSVDVDVKGIDIDTKLPEAEVQLGDLKQKSGGITFKGHLPSIKMPQMPKADIKGPKVDVTMPSVDVSLTKGKGDIKSPEVEVEGDITVGDKEMDGKDTKFKMPKFKMPSFGVSAPGKEASGDVSLPKAEVDVTLPSVQAGDLSVEMPSVDVDVKSLDIDTKLPEAEVQLGDLKGKSDGISLKGHLPKVHMPTMKMPQTPKADIKGPKVDITMPSLDVSLTKGKGDIKSPEVEVEGDIKLGEKEVEAKDSKFKMPKFKMPSFGMSAPGKEGAASMVMSLPSTEGDVALPSAEVDVKASDLSVDMPSVDVDVKSLDIDTKLPEAEVQLGDLKQKSGGITFKGHLPSIKMPQMPKADIKGPKVDVTMPSLDVSLPKGKGDIKSPEVEVEGDIKVGDKEMESKDSKFKMPKFKMPSFGVSGSSKEASGDLSLPKAEMDVTLPSVQAGDVSVEMPSVNVDVKAIEIDTKLPEGEVQLGDLKGKRDVMSLEGHLPKVHMPTMKMPQMPKADIKGPKVDITMPSVDVSLPKGKGDIKSPEVEVEEVIKLGDKEVEEKDSKFKMPKFKMPSFGVSGSGKEASGDLSLPKAEVDVTLPSVQAGDLSVELPSVDVDVKGIDIDTKLPEAEVKLGDLKGKRDGTSLKGHLPSIKMPQMPKADIKGPKVDITMPSVDVSLSKGKGDIKSPQVVVEGDIKLGDTEVELKDSKFKMPKFKMPSFGVSASGKEGVASMDMPRPSTEVDVALPSAEVDVKASDLSVDVPSVDVDVKGIDIDTKLPEAEVQLGDLKQKSGGITFKGHLPSINMPQMPKADIKGPKVDVTMPSVDVSLPKDKGDIKSPEVEIEGDIKVGDKEMDGKDSKFKMPKFTMPSFGVSARGKEASGDVSLPKAEMEVTLPCVEVDVQASDLSVELPSVDVDVKRLDIDTKLPEAEVQLGDLKGKSGGISLKGHLPKVHMPTMKMPQMPKADIKGPKVDITMPNVDVSLPKGKGDIKSPEVEVEGDFKVGDKEIDGKDSKFKMPKFKMPSFGVSASGKEASGDLSLPKAEVDVTLPSVQVGDLSVEMPSVDVDVKGIEIDTKLPEGEVQLGDLKGKRDGTSLKGHLPKVHMPTMKMPQTSKGDIKGPKVNITMPSMDVSLPKGKADIKGAEVEVEGDIKLGDTKVEVKDSKFKMPKFKMPSFGVSGSGKEASGDVSLPKAEVDVTLPSVQVGDVSVEMPSVDVDVKGIEIDTKLPEGEVQLGDLKGKRDGTSLKGHLPKVHMPTMKMPQMPKADIKGPKVDITMPGVDVSLPKGKGDIKSPEVEVEGDIKLGEKDVEAKDRKFKMPQFKMPSFGVSGSGKEGSGDLSLPKAEVEVTLPSVQAGDLSVDVPSVDVDVKSLDIDTDLPEAEVQLGDLKGKRAGITLKGHLPKVHMPTMKMPQMPKADIKGPKVDVTMPSLDVSLPKGKDDIKSPEVEVEGDIKVGDKEVEAKDSKFKMPKFKMPSFGVSAAGKEGAASMDMSLPSTEVDVALPSAEVDVKASDLSVDGPSVDVDVKGIDIDTKLPEGEVQLGDLKQKSGGITFKGHLPSIKMPQMPKADIKGPKVDVTMPSVDVSLPKDKGDIKSPEVEIEGDIKVGDKEMDGKDSKFKMPKFTMPSFGVSARGKEASGDVSLPKAEMEVTLPCVEVDVQASDLSVELPSVDVDVKRLDIDTKLPEAEVQLGDLKGKSGGISLKGHLPKVHMPTMKMPQMPKADIKGPKVDITMPNVDVSLPKGKGDIKSPEVEVEGDFKVGDKEIDGKDSKFKMPKFKMPSFGVSASGKEASGDLSLPKAEVDVTLPSVQVGDLSVEMPSVDVDVKGIEIDTKLPEGEVQLGDLKGKRDGTSLKGHLPKVHMPTMKMPQTSKGDIKGPKVNITMPSMDVSLPKGKADIKGAEVEVEGDIKLGDTKVEVKDSKFKMPKFKMPSFGVSGSGKEASGDVSLPKAEVDVTLPSVQVGDVSVEMPSVDVDVKGIEIDTKLPEGEVQLGDLKGKRDGTSLKGHLPKVHMPTMKMPQMPKADIKGPKVDITMPGVDVSLPKGKGDIKSPEVEVEGDIKLGEKDVEAKDSKFKMPQFKMPSFGVSGSGKEGSGDLSLPKAEVDVTLPSVQAGDLSVELPSVGVDVKSLDIDTKLSEAEVQLGDLKGKSDGTSLKGHLPKVHMPTMKMPQTPKADLKGPKVNITMPSMDVSLPKGKADIKDAEVEVEGDIKLGDTKVEVKDSKFKMPKFKMPSFGVSGSGKEGSGDLSLPKAEVEVTLPSVQAGDLSVDVPSVDVDVKSLDIDTDLPEAEVQLGDLKGKRAGITLKGHLPKVHMPTMKMPQMPKADIKGPKVDVTMPSLDVSLPKGKDDIKSPEVEIEGDIKVGDKEVEAKDSKFKMPKFKMPSFGVSAAGKEGAASMDMSLPSTEVDVALPSAEVDVKASDLSVDGPSVDVDVKGIDIDTKLPEGEVQLGDLKQKSGGITFKGHLPSIKMPQMPKADIKGPKVDVTMPSVDVSLPKGKGDIKSPEVEVEGDFKLGEKDVEAKDSKFKMPKFKMPSFGVSASGKEASVDVSLPQAEVDVTLPSVQVGDVSVEMPSVDVDVKGIDIDTKLPEGEVQLGDLKGKSDGVSLKGHLPKVHMPTMKMPQTPKADIKGPKVDVTMPSLDVSLPKGKGDIKGAEVEVEGDINLGEKEMDRKDSKFKMPKFKMPSFGVSASSKEASEDVSLRSSEANVTLPFVEVDVQASDLSVDMPLVDMDVKSLDIHTKLPEEEVQLGDLKGKSGGISLKGHFPKIHMPTMKMPQMPKADIKGPKVDVTMPSVDVSLPKGKGDIKGPEVEVEGDIKVGDKEIEAKDSKFKMPKFKMPSFGVSVPGKGGAASVDMSLPSKEVVVTLPSADVDVQACDLSVDVPSVDVDVKGIDIDTKLPEREVQLGDLKGKSGGIILKGHLPSIKMPQLPKADIKGPNVDVTMPSLDVSLPKGKGDIKSPEVQVEPVKVEGDIKVGDKEMEVKDSKFKMPKFKMPSFGGGKDGATSVDMSLPKAEVDVTLPSVQAADLSVEVPSVDVDVKGQDIEAHLPKGEVQFGDLKGKSGGISLKGHLPSMKMPQTPKADIKGPKVDITMPSLDVSLPKGKGDIKSPEVQVEPVKVEGDIKVGDKEMEVKDSKFKMPKFKMPSFGGGKDGATSVDMSLPKAEVDVTLPSVQAADLSVEVPSVDVDVKGQDIEAHLPKGEVQFGDLKGKSGGISLKGHLPSMKMPQMPKADIKGPKVDITMPSLDVSLPKGKGDIKSPEVQVEPVKVEGDIKVGDKEMEVKDSKFKMPKFKMPSFGGGKDGATSVDMSLPKAEVDVTLPSVQAADLSVEVPSVDVDIKGQDIEAHLPKGEVQLGDLKGKSGGISLKGHLPSMKISQMPKGDIKGPKGDVTMPSLDVSLPKGKGDIKSPQVEVEGDIKLEDKDVRGKDSKFRMPKFKMPSFGGGKEGAASVDVSLPKAEVDVTLPSVQASDLSVEVPSVDVDVKGQDIEAHLPKGEVQFGDLKGKSGGISLKGHLPKVHMPSKKLPQVPKADIKGPKVDITMPSPDVSLSKGKGDIKSPEVKVEGDIKVGDKEVEAKDSKFKMPKFKMPSFGSSHGRLHKSSVDSPSCHEPSDVSESSPDVHKEPEFSSALQDDSLLCDSSLKVEGSRMKLHMPKMNIPSIGFSQDDSKVSKSSATVACSSGETIMSSVDTSLPNLPATVGGTSGDILSSDIPVPETDTKKSDFKVQMPKIALPGHQFDGTLKPSDLKSCVVNLSEGELPEGELHVDTASSHLSDSHDGHSQFSGVSLPGWCFTKVNISGPHTEFGKTRVKEDITLTKYEVTLPMSGSHDIPSLPHPDTIPILERHSDMKSEEEESQISAGKWDERVQPASYVPDGMIKFPKFYKPKFGVSVSKPLEISHPQEPPNVAAEMTAQEVPFLFPKKEFMTSSETVKSSMHLSSVQTSQEGSDQLAVSDIQDSNIAPQTGKAEVVKPECTESEGKEGFFKMPKFKLPSFSWSPKKEAAPKGAPGSKPSDILDILDKEQVAADIETHTVSVETDMDASTEKESPKEKIKKPHFVMPKIGLPKVKGSKAGIGLQKEAEELSHSDDAPLEEDTKVVIDTSSKKTVLDTEVVQIVVPTAIRQTELQVPEGPAPGKMITQEPSGGKESGKEQLFLPIVQVPKLGSSVSQVKSHSIHISVPKLETDMSQLSPKVEIETVTLETETYADVLKRNIDDKSLKLCQTTAGMLDSTMSMSEVRVPSGENTVSLMMPSLGFSTSEIKDPRQETGEIVLPQHDMSMPGPQAIAKGEKDDVGLPESEIYLLPTEGPIKLKTSSTEIPSQVSVIETSRVWEGSVLTVKFPKLQVPKFTFQAPNTEADIFIPKVREVMCPETDIEIAIHKESPDEWSAKVLKAGSEIPPQPSPDPIRPPKDLALSSVASPISKVKVHIQGAHIESQEVTIESRVTCEHGELPRRETFSTQIVRASEIPPSDIQTPSYGFSLLKVKIPESHVNLDVTGKEQETLGHTSSTLETQDISEESLRKDELGVDTDLSLEGELQPETGEPYEIISSSASLPKLKTFTFEVHSSHQYADSYSDEEPAEILEFPPEDSHDQIPPDEEKEQKVQSESKKSSGLFRFWLPSIGFSSSVDEANSDSKTEVSKSVPIQTQPEAMSDIESKKPEKTGWFRFPKLGFSSSPAKKSKSTEESVTDPTKSGSQEEAEQTVIFFDAQETLSPEEREGGESITSTTNDDGALVTSSARTELILLEEEGKTAGKAGSGHVAK
ncbi:protein AHNAK2 isoform X3 [Sminthopsis crassicaudata]|uniref:protein AHNAK2 isoform X3 n=1 Tax=Sminthopsis crassicaudata TaxID=9301 RepID=UPI003D687355